jgi:hypothetical protein
MTRAWSCLCHCSRLGLLRLCYSSRPTARWQASCRTVNYTARNQVLTFGTVPVFDRVLDHSVASTEPLSWHCKISGPAPDALLWVRESEWLKVQAVLERHNVAAQALRAFRCPTLDAYEQTLVDRTLERTSPTSQDAAETAARQMARTRIDEARVVAAQTNISDPATKRCAIS